MGKVYESIDSNIKGWLQKQPMFFIATSPLSEDGHINLSPKGHDTLRFIDEHTVAYADYGGSGIETVAHVRENKRIVLMACAFEGKPKIIRLHGNGSVVTGIDDEFAELAKLFDGNLTGIRAIIKIDVTRVSDSCGFGVPLMEFKQHRDTSMKFRENAGNDKMREYFQEHNLLSIDGLPGLTAEEGQGYLGPDEL